MEPLFHPFGLEKAQDPGGQLEGQEQGQCFADGGPGQLEEMEGPHHADAQHHRFPQRSSQEKDRTPGEAAGQFHVHAVPQGNHRDHRTQDMALEKGDDRQGHADDPGQEPGGVPARQHQDGVHQGADEESHDRNGQRKHQPELLAEGPDGQEQAAPDQKTERMGHGIGSFQVMCRYSELIVISRTEKGKTDGVQQSEVGSLESGASG